MRRILLISLLTVALAGAARAQGTGRSQSDAQTEEEVLKVEREKDQAMQKGDLATLTRVYADDLIFVNPRGEVLSKAQRLADVRPGTLTTKISRGRITPCMPRQIRSDNGPEFVSRGPTRTTDGEWLRRELQRALPR